MWDTIAREFPVMWKPRREPLTAVALAGCGVTRYIIHERLRRRTPAELEDLNMVSAEDYFILLGEKSRLPWASGGVYLGVDPDAPSLLLPVNLQPTLPAHFLESVLRSRAHDASMRIAVLPHPLRAIAVADARPALSHEALGPAPARRRVVPSAA